VRERVGTNNRLVGLDDKAGGLRDHARSRHDLRGIDAQGQIEVVTARLHRHHDFFE